MKGRDVIGTIIIVIGALIILDLFVSFLDLIFDFISFEIILGIGLIVVGIFIIKGHENIIEERKDKIKGKMKE